MHAFLEEEIDGSSFLLLKETDVVDFRLKTGSMVKLREYLEKLRAVPVSLNDCLTATNSDNIEIDRACANMVTPPPDLNITVIPSEECVSTTKEVGCLQIFVEAAFKVVFSFYF